MRKAVIGIGANIGDRKESICGALKALELLPGTRLAKVSAVYETLPVGYADQPNFYNCCAMLETGLSPEALLGACLGVEAGMGRVRQFKNGPRIVDLDLLLYEGAERCTQECTVPHPRMLERGFVLAPLLDLFPEGEALGLSFAGSLKCVQKDDIREVFRL